MREIEPFRTLLFGAKVNVAINIAEQSLQDDAFVDSVERWLGRLRRHECRCSLDDFGAGVNPLSHLRILPVSQVKIDASVTRDLLSNEPSAAHRPEPLRP